MLQLLRERFVYLPSCRHTFHISIVVLVSRILSEQGSLRGNTGRVFVSSKSSSVAGKIREPSKHEAAWVNKGFSKDTLELCVRYNGDRGSKLEFEDNVTLIRSCRGFYDFPNVYRESSFLHLAKGHLLPSRANCEPSGFLTQRRIKCDGREKEKMI